MPYSGQTTPVNAVKHVLLVFLILLNLFLAYRLIWGDQGVLAHRELQSQNEALKARLNELAQQQQFLSDEIRLLRSDASHIEAIIRSRLNFVREDEVLYMFPEGIPQADTTISGAEADETKD